MELSKVGKVLFDERIYALEKRIDEMEKKHYDIFEKIASRLTNIAIEMAILDKRMKAIENIK